MRQPARALRAISGQIDHRLPRRSPVKGHQGARQACLMLKPASPLSVFRGLEAGFSERARKPMGAVAPRRNTVSGVWSAMEPDRWARGADGPGSRSRFGLYSRDGEGRVSRAV